MKVTLISLLTVGLLKLVTNPENHRISKEIFDKITAFNLKRFNMEPKKSPLDQRSIEIVRGQEFSIKGMHPGQFTCPHNETDKAHIAHILPLHSSFEDFNEHKKVCNELGADCIAKYKNHSLAEEVEKASDTDAKGYLCRFAGDNYDQQVSIGINTLKQRNFIALNKFLRKEPFLQKNAIAMINTLLKGHALLFQDIDTPGLTPGKYRDQIVFIHGDKENIDDIIQKGFDQLSPYDQKLYMDAAKDMEEPVNLSPEQRSILSKVVKLSPNVNQIPKLMLDFVFDLKDMYELTGDPIAIAAFAHQSLVSIFPFADGNGRLARSLMNTLLIQSGKPPIAFLNDELYSKLSSAGTTPNGITKFSQYIEECQENQRIHLEKLKNQLQLN